MNPWHDRHPGSLGVCYERGKVTGTFETEGGLGEDLLLDAVDVGLTNNQAVLTLESIDEDDRLANHRDLHPRLNVGRVIRLLPTKTIVTGANEIGSVEKVVEPGVAHNDLVESTRRIRAKGVRPIADRIDLLDRPAAGFGVDHRCGGVSSDQDRQGGEPTNDAGGGCGACHPAADSASACLGHQLVEISSRWDESWGDLVEVGAEAVFGLHEVTSRVDSSLAWARFRRLLTVPSGISRAAAMSSRRQSA